MCFRLHSNTPTVPATRGTKSNKAEREGSREGVVTVTLSTKGGGEEKKTEMNTAWIFRDNVKSVRSMNRRRSGSCLPPTPKIPLQGLSPSPKWLFERIWMYGAVGKRNAQYITCICIMLLSVTDKEINEGNDKSSLSERENSLYFSRDATTEVEAASLKCGQPQVPHL